MQRGAKGGGGSVAQDAARSRWGRSAALAPLVLLAALLALVPGGAARAGRPAASAPSPSLARHAVVPVLAQVDGRTLTGRLRFARVAVYDLGAGPGVGTARQLVGSGHTGAGGLALVPLRGDAVPRRLLVVVAGGRLGGRRFGGTLRAQVADSGSHAVFATPLSTLAALYLARHPRGSVAGARRLVGRALRLPARVDPSVAMADPGTFDGRVLLSRARAAGGFDRYLATLAGRVGTRARISFTTAGARRRTRALARQWACAATSTTGFARYVGVARVPAARATPACAARAGASAAAARAGGPLATAAGLGPNDVFSDALGIAGLVYGVVGGESTATTEAQLQQQLTGIQEQLTTVGQQLVALTGQVNAVSGQISTGNLAITTAIADGVITNIQVTSDDAVATLAAAEALYATAAAQIPAAQRRAWVRSAGTPAQLCAGVTPRSSPTLFNACNDLTNMLGNLELQIRQQGTVRAGVTDLAKYAIGGAAAGGSGPGIVQLALQDGAGTSPFFTSADAADARLEWAYYTFYAAFAQSLETTLLTFDMGGRLPSGAVVTRSVVLADANALGGPLVDLLGAYPNMPDGAVVNLKDGTVWAQTLGGSGRSSAVAAATSWQLSGDSIYGNVAGSRLSMTSGTSGAAPIATAPLGSGWRFATLVRSVARGGRATLPAMATSTYQDWKIPGATTLASLYASKAPASGQTAGQWMTAASGIAPVLLTPEGTGYSGTYGGAYVGKTTSFAYGGGKNQTGMTVASCIPAGDAQCLLPTWLNPSSQPSQGSTGLFDYNSGVPITTQSLDSRCPANQMSSLGSTPWGSYPNWTGTIAVNNGNPFQPVLPFFQGTPSPGRGLSAQAALSDWPCNNPSASGVQVNQLGMASSTGRTWLFQGLPQYGVGAAWVGIPDNFSQSGRPVLFERVQSGGDCFWYGGSSNPATGPGCLTPRTTASAVLPRLAAPFGASSNVR